MAWHQGSLLALDDTGPWASTYPWIKWTELSETGLNNDSVILQPSIPVILNKPRGFPLAWVVFRRF